MTASLTQLSRIGGAQATSALSVVPDHPAHELEALLAIQGEGMEAAAEVGELTEANVLEGRFMGQMDREQEQAYGMLRRALVVGHVDEVKAAVRASLVYLGRAEHNQAEAARWDAIVDACAERAGGHARAVVSIAEGRRRAIQRRRQRADAGGGGGEAA